MGVIMVLLGLALAFKLGQLQITDRELYKVLASDQHDLQAQLLPTRGRILVRDKSDDRLYPLATNHEVWTVYAVPRSLEDPIAAAHVLAEIVNIPDVDLVTRFNKPDDPYEVVIKNASKELVEEIQAKEIKGIGYVRTSARLYPEQGVSGQLIGFVGSDSEQTQVGKYGIEGSFDSLLAGRAGSIFAEKDASGRRLVMADSEITEATDGADIVLTIDRTIQYQACSLIKEAVGKHSADSGSIIIMEPNTGAIMAMCSFPDFDPAEFGKADSISVYNNPVTLGTYEPGSVFKPFVMAAGLDTQKISPNTTYTDEGSIKFGPYTIRNSDGKAYGLQTMTQVLAASLNTGTIYVQRLIGKETFLKYVKAFGFGALTEIELTPESKGDISSLSKSGEIYAATGSYGQGLSVTPLQIVAAFGALANGGKLMRPYVVEEIIHADGTRERTKPQEVGQPIDSRTSRLISGMLVAVVEEGHGKRAGVPGYWVGGKTGTAQVAKSNGPGYETDVTIGSFAGFAPISDPRFVMLVKIDHPRDVQWAESSAAPLFGQMAKFLLTYMQVPPEREANYVAPPPPAPPESEPAEDLSEGGEAEE